jgi:anthranilate/para-aminobenzoate synthase component II
MGVKILKPTAEIGSAFSVFNDYLASSERDVFDQLQKISDHSFLVIIDFEDSFIYNIVSEFLKIDCPVCLIHWRHLPQILERQILRPEKQQILLGPGPGHPEDYDFLRESLMKWLRQDGAVSGICMGHQLLCTWLGLPLEASRFPSHGESHLISVPRFWQKKCHIPAKIKVQRYNSLAVLPPPLVKDEMQLWVEKNEVIGLSWKKVMSYQFHPESVATSHNDLLHRSLLCTDFSEKFGL